jgi:hypothetical protein
MVLITPISIINGGFIPTKIYKMYGVTAWPNVEAEQAHYKDLAKIGWHRYTYARTILRIKNS